MIYIPYNMIRSVIERERTIFVSHFLYSFSTHQYKKERKHNHKFTIFRCKPRKGEIFEIENAQLFIHLLFYGIFK